MLYVLGSLSKHRRRQQRERHQIKQWLHTCDSNLCTFHCSPLQNKSVTLVISNNDGQFFVFPFGIDRGHGIFSLSASSERLAYCADQDKYTDSKSLTGRCPRRSASAKASNRDDPSKDEIRYKQKTQAKSSTHSKLFRREVMFSLAKPNHAWLISFCTCVMPEQTQA